MLFFISFMSEFGAIEILHIAKWRRIILNIFSGLAETFGPLNTLVENNKEVNNDK